MDLSNHRDSVRHLRCQISTHRSRRRYSLQSPLNSLAQVQYVFTTNHRRSAPHLFSFSSLAGALANSAHLKTEKGKERHLKLRNASQEHFVSRRMDGPSSYGRSNAQEIVPVARPRLLKQSFLERALLRLSLWLAVTRDRFVAWTL
jgi:hypothetical protein